jgi:GTPase
VKLAVKEFWCTILIHHSPTTIRTGYQPFVHVDQARQSVRIMEILKQNPSAASSTSGSATATTSTGSGVSSTTAAAATIPSDEDPVLRTGDKAHIRCKFLVRPEYIKPGMKLIFREGRVKAAGRVMTQGLE